MCELLIVYNYLVDIFNTLNFLVYFQVFLHKKLELDSV